MLFVAGKPLFDQPLPALGKGIADLPAESTVAERYGRVGGQFAIETSGAVSAELPLDRQCG